MQQARDAWETRGGIALVCGIGLAISAIARLGFGYPWCLSGNDESFWIVILESRLQGFHYPISGLLYVELLAWAVPLLGVSVAHGVSWLGLLSVPIVLAVACVFYRRALPDSFWWVLAALAMTAYFWAPLIESKPQQWGQWGLLICGWMLARRLVDERAWWPLAAGATVLASMHILSFGILIAISGWLWLFYLLLGRTTLAAGVRAALSLLPGVALLLWPNGPYSVSVDVIAQHHITDWTAISALAGGVVIVSLLGFATALRLQRGAPAIARFASGFNLGRTFVFWGLLFTSTACFAVQAALLPANYWQLYDYSSVRFLLAQAGNVLFAAFALHGAVQIVGTRGPASCALHHFAALALATALTGALALLITLWTTDTNWLLRVVSYAVLFAAPLAARSLKAAYCVRPVLTGAFCAGAAIVSVLSSVRWAGLIAC